MRDANGKRRQGTESDLGRTVTAAVAGALLLGGAWLVAASEEPEHSYVGVRKCKSCHRKDVYGDQVAAWRKGVHARAYETLASEEAHAVAARSGVVGAPQQAEACLRCHVTAHGVRPEWIKFELKISDGVQCESCHGPGADYRKRDRMSSRKRAMRAGLWESSIEVCERCHNSESPTWDQERYVRADGTRTGFAYEQAVERIAHPIPEENRGRVSEIEEAMKEAEKKR